MIFQYTPGFHHPIFLYTIVVQYTVMRHSVYQSFQYTIMRHFSIPKSEIFSIPCAIFQYTKVWDFQYTVRHFSKPKSEIFSNTTLYYPIFQYTSIRHFSTPNMMIIMISVYRLAWRWRDDPYFTGPRYESKAISTCTIR